MKGRTHLKPKTIAKYTNENFKGTNSNIVFYGTKGIGKSMILNYAAAWAHETGWISFILPKA